MRNAQQALGRYGEEVAVRRLGQDGLRVLERNWRCAQGELDIVALDGDTVAVCEVKTRSEGAFQQPEEALGPVKAERLRVLAERWLAERWPAHFARLAGLPAAPPGAGASPGESAGVATGAAVAGDGHGAVVPPPGGVRIDLVCVVSRSRGAARVQHLRGVV
ncbi:YraN family protein [Kitasatospora sp. NPDC058965]|uniref:YraN family protein n=1 Tax=Kitasatospora sp. NPDC058965 TaxID=3346682 RepID=UPI00369D4558